MSDAHPGRIWLGLAACLTCALLGAGVTRLACLPATPAAVPGEAPRPVATGLAAATDGDWLALPPASFPIPPYARFLKDVRIVLDPGHGGRGHLKKWKRGPTGLREAEVNLSVALCLRDLLARVGADVTLTRSDDSYLDADNSADLRARAALANRLRADLLLSIHHNGAASPKANYTTVFYHGRPDDSPASLDAARHILYGLNDALRLDRHLECAVLSDYALFPPPKNDGLALLRQARVPAVLSEASFHSNPEEEQRLRDPDYNLREAYGLFLGLARWAQSGLCRVRLLNAPNQVGPGRELQLELDDGLARRGGFGAETSKISAASIDLRLNGQPLPFEFDPVKRIVRCVPGEQRWRARNTLTCQFRNQFGQAVLHPEVVLE